MLDRKGGAVYSFSDNYGIIECYDVIKYGQG